MMKLIKTEEITENGVDYILETYQSDKTGQISTVKTQKSEPVEIEPMPVDKPIDTEILLCETLSVAEYNSCLLEMMM